jgi:DNA-binding LytR/AlgR family response regulator
MRLDDIETQLAPHLFFRANRQYIVHVNAIANIRHYFNRKLRLCLVPNTTDEVLVSREKATQFKVWLNQ